MESKICLTRRSFLVNASLMAMGSLVLGPLRPAIAAETQLGICSESLIDEAASGGNARDVVLRGPLLSRFHAIQKALGSPRAVTVSARLDAADRILFDIAAQEAGAVTVGDASGGPIVVRLVGASGRSVRA